MNTGRAWIWSELYDMIPKPKQKKSVVGILALALWTWVTMGYQAMHMMDGMFIHVSIPQTGKPPLISWKEVLAAANMASPLRARVVWPRATVHAVCRITMLLA